MKFKEGAFYFFYFHDFLSQEISSFFQQTVLYNRLENWFPQHFLHSLTVNYGDFTETWISLYCNHIYNLWTYVIVVQ